MSASTAPPATGNDQPDGGVVPLPRQDRPVATVGVAGREPSRVGSVDLQWGVPYRRQSSEIQSGEQRVEKNHESGRTAGRCRCLRGARRRNCRGQDDLLRHVQPADRLLPVQCRGRQEGGRRARRGTGRAGPASRCGAASDAGRGLHCAQRRRDRGGPDRVELAHRRDRGSRRAQHPGRDPGHQGRQPACRHPDRRTAIRGLLHVRPVRCRLDHRQARPWHQGNAKVRNTRPPTRSASSLPAGSSASSAATRRSASCSRPPRCSSRAATVSSTP